MKTFWTQRFGKVTISFEWKLEDLWVGVFWRKSQEQVGHAFAGGSRSALIPVIAHNLDVWVCLLPCLPIHIRKDV